MTQVFISYSSKDRDKAASLAAALRDYGVEVWWDRHLVGGDDFRDQIDEHLSNAHAVILILTENALESRWVRAEAEVGLRNGNLVPVRYASGLRPFDGMKHLHAEFLGDWNGAPRAEPIGKLVKRINDLKSERDRKDLLAVMPLGNKVRHSGFAKAVFDLSLRGGLRVRTLVLGALVGALPLWCALLLISTQMTEIRIGPDAFVLIVGLLLFTRVLDQWLVVSKDGCSDRFFDRSFSFSLVVCVLAGLIIAICAGLADHLTSGAPLELNRMGLATLSLTLALLLATYVVRGLILAGRTLHQRI